MAWNINNDSNLDGFVLKAMRNYKEVSEDQYFGTGANAGDALNNPLSPVYYEWRWVDDLEEWGHIQLEPTVIEENTGGTMASTTSKTGVGVFPNKLTYITSSVSEDCYQIVGWQNSSSFIESIDGFFPYFLFAEDKKTRKAVSIFNVDGQYLSHSHVLAVPNYFNPYDDYGQRELWWIDENYQVDYEKRIYLLKKCSVNVINEYPKLCLETTGESFDWHYFDEMDYDLMEGYAIIYDKDTGNSTLNKIATTFFKHKTLNKYAIVYGDKINIMKAIDCNATVPEPEPENPPFTTDKCDCETVPSTKTFYLRKSKLSATDQELLIKKTKTVCTPKEYEPELKWICDDAKMEVINQQMKNK